MDKQENIELFKQALVEGLNERFDRELAKAKAELTDPSGVILTPGGDCLGDGTHVDEYGREEKPRDLTRDERGGSSWE